jgi:type VI secretion system secreted protein VgrG
MGREQPLFYWLDLGEARLAVREIRGEERISKPFRLDLRLFAEGLPGDPDELVTTAAAVHLARGAEHVRTIHGVITEIAAGAAVRGLSAIRVVVEPQLALLRHRKDFRVFRDKTAPEIIEEVLARAGIVEGGSLASGLELRLTRSYARRPYCVQCQESDFDFVHRLMEDEGIHYFFREHEGLVLGDSAAAYQASIGAATLPFRGGQGLDGHDDDAVTAVARRARATVGKVSLKDFDLDKPSLDLSASAPGPSEGGPEAYDYPGEYTDPGVGAAKAKLRAEAHACASTGYAGESSSGKLAPGHTLSIEGTPAGVGDGQHVITAVTHAWQREASGFHCAFESLDAGTAFRPLPATPVPTLVNPMSGFVTGPAGEDIHTDEQGRVKVHFHWDRLQPFDDHCSHWIPVLQDNTGHSVGIPRVGWEVLVHFLEGDPDRPVVLGRLYNAGDNFPNPLPADKTKSALKSLSSPGRNGTNQIELEDKAGQEKITVLAEKDQDIQVAHDKASTIQHDEEIQVIRDERVEIGHDQTEQVDGDETHTIERDQTRTVGGSRKREVTKTEESTVAKDRRLTIGGMHQRKVGTDDIVQAKNLTERVSAVNLEAFVKTNSTTSNMIGLLTVGGALIEVAKEQKTESAGKARVETVGGLVFTKAGEAISAKAGSSRIVTVGGALSATAQGPIAVDAKLTVSMEVGAGKLDGTAILLKVGESFVLLNEGVAVLNAAKTLRLEVDAKNAMGSPGIAVIPAAYKQNKAKDSDVDGKAGGAGGGGKTGSGNVDAGAKTAAGAALQGAGPKGEAAKLAALKEAAAAGYELDPAHCNLSLKETLRSYASQLGIRQDADGQAIPLTGKANEMLSTLDARSATYGAAGAAKQAELRDQGLAWESVSREQATSLANQGEMVVAGLPDERDGHSGHVATVVPGAGVKAPDGNVYPYVSGGGTGAGASDGTRTAGQVWSTKTRADVGYYHYVPPSPPAAPAQTSPASPGGLSI